MRLFRVLFYLWYCIRHIRCFKLTDETKRPVCNKQHGAYHIFINDASNIINTLTVNLRRVFKYWWRFYFHFKLLREILETLLGVFYIKKCLWLPVKFLVNIHGSLLLSFTWVVYKYIAVSKTQCKKNIKVSTKKYE